MEKTIRLCDRCGKGEANRYSFEVDRESDGIGGNDTVSKDVDLCRNCEYEQLKLFIYSLPWPSRKLFTEKIMKKGFYLSDMANSGWKREPGVLYKGDEKS